MDTDFLAEMLDRNAGDRSPIARRKALNTPPMQGRKGRDITKQVNRGQYIDYDAIHVDGRRGFSKWIEATTEGLVAHVGGNPSFVEHEIIKGYLKLAKMELLCQNAILKGLLGKTFNSGDLAVFIKLSDSKLRKLLALGLKRRDARATLDSFRSYAPGPRVVALPKKED